MFDFALRSCGATVHIILQLASLCNMSIGRGVVLAVAFQKVDAAPHAKAAAQVADRLRHPVIPRLRQRRKHDRRRVGKEAEHAEQPQLLCQSPFHVSLFPPFSGVKKTQC